VALLAASVVAVVAELAALTALAAASLAFVVAMTACCVTANSVASLLLSPAPPSPLNIAIVAPTKTKERENKKGGLRRIPQFSLKYS
jgi:ABC-type phosphate/phosphonate transport system substrate-binding protein